jgi:hypothetical protein
VEGAGWVGGAVDLKRSSVLWRQYSHIPSQSSVSAFVGRPRGRNSFLDRHASKLFTLFYSVTIVPES